MEAGRICEINAAAITGPAAVRHFITTRREAIFKKCFVCGGKEIFPFCIGNFEPSRIYISARNVVIEQRHTKDRHRASFVNPLLKYLEFEYC